MTEIKIREMRADETPLLVKWLYKHRETNLVDLEVFRKNQVRIFVAEDEEGVICFIPIQAIYMYDALAPRPDIKPEQLASAFANMNTFLWKLAREENVGKVLVQPSDKKFSEFIQRHFDFVPVIRETLELNFNEVSESAKCESV
jgi:hypothetical protein